MNTSHGQTLESSDIISEVSPSGYTVHLFSEKKLWEEVKPVCMCEFLEES